MAQVEASEGRSTLVSNLHLLSFVFSGLAVALAAYADVQSRRAKRWADRAEQAAAKVRMLRGES